MIKVLFLLGTRPEAIKLAPVIRLFKSDHEFDVKVGVTGQHREMLDQVLVFFKITADFDLDIMEPNQTLPDITAKIIRLVSNTILTNYNPDWLVVQGDTTTAMAGALAAFYGRIRIAHVEAGLRSYNLYSPYPEEMNRVVISKLAACHLCPTDSAVENLEREGISNGLHQVGNTVIDAVLLGLHILEQTDQQQYLDFFKSINFTRKIILVTCHRRESFGEPFENICKALVKLADRAECQVVYPVHLNPNIQQNAQRYLSHHPNIVLMDPLPYDYLLWLMNKSHLILTDSGGIQEEAPTLNKPVLVLRDVTERMEGVTSGTAILVGTNAEKIVHHSIDLLTNQERFAQMANRPNPYGDGKTSERIAHILKGKA